MRNQRPMANTWFQWSAQNRQKGTMPTTNLQRGLQNGCRTIRVVTESMLKSVVVGGILRVTSQWNAGLSVRGAKVLRSSCSRAFPQEEATTDRQRIPLSL